MSYRRKEEKAIERIIRGLMKLPENRRCMNCEHLGPRYVCTSFSTFVCTVCSGVHREFGHRVKSVLVATFTSEEVIALQAGGNERAREIYLEAWDPTRNTQPNGSDIDRIRDFIKHVYVDKRFTGERRFEKSGDKDNFYERHSIGRHGLSSREDFYERRHQERSSPRGRGDRNHRDNYTDHKSNRNYNNDKYYSKYFEGSSPRSIYERFGSHRRRSAARFEIVDNRIRDDRYGRGGSESLKKSKTHTSMSPEPQREEENAGPMEPEPQRREEKTDPVAPEPQTIRKKANPPVLRPLKDIMRQIAQTNKAANATKANKAKDADGAPNHQKTALSDKLDSADVKEDEAASASRLTDFKNNLQSPDTSLKTQTESSSSIQSSTMHKTSTPPNVNFVEFLLSELSFAPAENASEDPDTNTASPTAPNTSTTPVAPLTEPVSSSVVPTASSTASVASSTVPVTSSAVAATTESASTPKTLATHFDEIAQTHPFSSTDSVPQVTEENKVQTTQQHQPWASPAENSSSTPNSACSVSRVAEEKKVQTTQQNQPCASPAENNSSTPDSADPVSRIAEEKKVQTTLQHQPSASPAENNSSTGLQGMSTFEALFDQSWTSLPEQTAQEAPGNVSVDQSSPAVFKEAQNTISPGNGSKTSGINGSKTSGRKELPAELFTFTYPTYPAPMHNWQFHPPRGMGYGMQYAPLPNVAAFPSSPKSRNPFDVEDDPRAVQGAMSPSIASVPGALAQMPSPFASGLPQESPSYGMYMPTGGYTGQQLPNNPPNQRLQGNGSFGGGSAFASFNSTQHYPGGPSNSFPAAGGNPFA